MSARDRYAGMSQVERRQAAAHVRRADKREQLNRERLDVFSDLVCWGMIDNGQVPQYWLYCWELATRVYDLRQTAGIVDGAR